MNVTVAIKCHRDRAVFDCIRSAHGAGEVLVLLSEGDPLMRQLAEQGVRCVVVAKNDIGMRCNAAMRSARFDEIVFVDSDCRIAPGALQKLAEALEEHTVVRARLEFCAGEWLTTRAAAAWRSWENNAEPVPAFMPGLGLRRDRISHLGERPFVEGLLFSVDDAFDAHLKAEAIPVHFVHEAVVVHGVVTGRHFLRAAFRTGRGTARQVKLGLRLHTERLAWLLASALRLRWLRTLVARSGEVGTAGAIAGAIWHVVYVLGYLFEYWIAGPMRRIRT